MGASDNFIPLFCVYLLSKEAAHLMCAQVHIIHAHPAVLCHKFHMTIRLHIRHVPFMLPGFAPCRWCTYRHA